MMTKNRRMDHTTDRHPCGRALQKHLREVFLPDQTSQPPHELTHIHAGTMKIGQSLQEDRTRKRDGPEQDPDEWPSFGNKFEHESESGEKE
jgi:hypothetical protein